MSGTVESVNCDNCGSSDATVAFQLQDDLYEIPGSFTMQTCQNCGLMYLSPRPTTESIVNYYPDTYENYKSPIEQEPLAVLRWMRSRKLARRRQLVELYSNRTGGDLLDVGCATGLFMNEMAQGGWNVQGIEPIESAAAIAHKNYGFEIHNGTMMNAPYDDGSFDVITFWDVLEHTFFPSQELTRSAALLRPGGLLALTIPNWHSLERDIFQEKWQGLDPPRHLYVFPMAVLKNMLTVAGFRVLDELCFMSSYFSFAISFERWLKARNRKASKMAGSVARIPGMRLLFEPWLSQVNRRGRGSVIAVFAERVAEEEIQK